MAIFAALFMGAALGSTAVAQGESPATESAEQAPEVQSELKQLGDDFVTTRQTSEQLVEQVRAKMKEARATVPPIEDQRKIRVTFSTERKALAVLIDFLRVHEAQLKPAIPKIEDNIRGLNEQLESLDSDIERAKNTKYMVPAGNKTPSTSFQNGGRGGRRG